MRGWLEGRRFSVGRVRRAIGAGAPDPGLEQGGKVAIMVAGNRTCPAKPGNVTTRACHRVPPLVEFLLRLGWTMVTSWSWMVERNRSMYTALRLNWRDLGLILRTVGYLSTLSPVH